MAIKLQDHQRRMMRYSMRVFHPALFVDMRLRKTLVTVRRISAYNKWYKILVVCPYSAFSGWRKEIAATEPSAEIIEIVGTRKQRLAVLSTVKRWALINKEGWASIALELRNFHWDVVVLDESRFIANPTNGASKYFTKFFRDARHRWCLTGTPAPESELEYFQQLKFLDPSILGYNNFYDWRMKNFMLVGHEWRITRAGRERLTNALAKYTLHIKREDVKLGGVKLYQTRDVILSAGVMAKLKRLEKEFVLELDNGKLKGTVWATQKFLWLRRLCGGAAKRDALHTLLCDEFRGEPVIIWASFVEEVEQIAQMLGVPALHGQMSPRDRDHAIASFQSGDIDRFVAQPECFKHGVDLSRAGTMIYYSTPMGSETRQQSEDRFVTLDKCDSLLVIDLVCKGTIEEDIYTAVRNKESQQSLIRRLIEKKII